MAYSDYGAFIWKNGKNITDEYADTSCKIENGKFILKDWYCNLAEEVNESKDIKTIGGHAIVNLEKFCIVFYKKYNPVIYFQNGESKEIDIQKKYSYELKKEKLFIRGYNLGKQTGYFFYEIDYKDDKYCVIVGSAIGKGWEKTPASKYVLKHLILFERQDGKLIYKIETKRDVDEDIVFNKLNRMEYINFEKRWKKQYFEGMLKHIIKLQIKNVAWDLEQILNCKEKIRWLK